MRFLKSKNLSEVIEAALLVDSTYSLLLYVLMYGKNRFEKTFFFTSDAISEAVRSKMRYHDFLSYRKFCKGNFFSRFFSRFMLHRLSYIKWPFLKHVSIYGADHLWYSAPLLKNRTMTVLEDGVGNYDCKALERTTHFKHKLFYKWAFGSLMCEGEYGYPPQVNKVVLTGINAVPNCLKDKIILVSMQDLWKKMADKEFVLNLFDLTNDDVSRLNKRRVVVLTQPLESVLGEDELVNIYRQVITPYRADEVVIKTHPRDVIDYSKHFPDVFVFSKQIPAELFSLIGIGFTDAYSICSTAVFSFPDSVAKHFLGTECHPLLLKEYGKITMENVVGN